jgi:structural maintenance of chromosomes protein 6
VTEKATGLHKVEQRIPKIQRSLDEADVSGSIRITIIISTLGQQKFNVASAAVELYEREHENLGNIDHLMEKKKTLSETLRTNRNKLSNLKVFRKSTTLLCHAESPR